MFNTLRSLLRTIHVRCLSSHVTVSVIGVERHRHGKLQLGDLGNLVGDGVELCQRVAIGVFQHYVAVGQLCWIMDNICLSTELLFSNTEIG